MELDTDTKEHDIKEEKTMYKTCEAMDIHNILLFPLDKLFIDIRPNEQYLKNHIFQFTNIPINTDEKLVIEIIKNKLNDFCQNASICIYFHSNKDIIKNQLDINWYKYIEELLYKQINDDNCYSFKSFNILSMDFESFATKYDYLCTKNIDKYPNMDQYPSIIIENKLFLGDNDDAQNKDNIIKFGITHILNLTYNVDNKHKNDKELSYLTYLQCSINDSNDTDISKIFAKCIAFIDNALNENDTNIVLVHCIAGVSRSPTIIIAYLMKINKMKYIDAFNFVKHKRPIIAPNEGFQKQLQLWEQATV